MTLFRALMLCPDFNTVQTSGLRAQERAARKEQSEFALGCFEVQAETFLLALFFFSLKDQPIKIS